MHLEVLRAQVGNGELLLEQREGQGRPEEAAEGAVAVQVAHLFVYVRERGYRQVAHLCTYIRVCAREGMTMMRAIVYSGGGRGRTSCSAGRSGLGLGLGLGLP